MEPLRVCSREKTFRVEAEFCVEGAAVKRNFDKTWEVASGEGNLKFNFRKDCIRSVQHRVNSG